MSSFFFFFQAEDGIRDLTVTGVQTCALPISRAPRPPLGAGGGGEHGRLPRLGGRELHVRRLGQHGRRHGDGLNGGSVMARKGLSHVGLSTLDMDRTRAFYEGVLGFEAVRCDTMQVKEGGQIRHVFFDAGDGQLLAFMEPRGVPGVPGEYDAGINRGLGLPDMFYHFAFEVGSLEALEAKRAELIAKGVRVTPVVDHEWMKSIYFKDPNGLLLEYACWMRALGDEDARMQVRFTVSLRGASPVTDFRDR